MAGLVYKTLAARRANNAVFVHIVDVRCLAVVYDRLLLGQAGVTAASCAEYVRWRG